MERQSCSKNFDSSPPDNSGTWSDAIATARPSFKFLSKTLTPDISSLTIFTPIFALAFLTSETKGEIAKRKNQKMINVFMPSTPNPTTGFLMFVPLSKCTKLNMSVDQAIKYIISAGLVTPKAPEIKKALPKKKKIKKLTK